MRIDPTAAMQSTLLGLLKSAKGHVSPAFPPEPSTSLLQPTTLPSAAATTSVGMLVALAAQGLAEARRPAFKRAEDALGSLARLRRLLLAGADPRGLRDELARHDLDGADAGAATDLLDEVRLRLLVELAKLER